MQNQTSPLILTFGCADPIGAIGVHADQASFAAMGCFALSVTTSILIGDTAKIEDVQEIDADWVADQARVILEDMPVVAFKVGAINNIETLSVIAEIVSDYPESPLILDPFASSMPDQDQDTEDMFIALREILIPQSTLLMLSAVELTRLAETWRDPSTENLIELDAMQRAKTISAMKAVVSAAALFVGRNAVQLHGGIGITEECLVSHLYRRLFTISGLFGNEETHLRRMAGG